MICYFASLSLWNAVPEQQVLLVASPANFAQEEPGI